MSEVEETLSRIKNHKSVQGYIIVNNELTFSRSSYPAEEKEVISKPIHQLTMKARSIIRDLDPTNDLTFLRVKSKYNEIMVSPDKDFMLMVIQGPKNEKQDNQD